MDKFISIITGVLDEMGINYIIQNNKAVFNLLRYEYDNDYNEETNKIEFIKKSYKENISVEMYDKIIFGISKIGVSIDGNYRGVHTHYEYSELKNIRYHLKELLKSFLKDNELPKQEYYQTSIFDFIGDE